MSSPHTHLLAITNDAARWQRITARIENHRIVIEPVVPDPTLVLQELLIRHYPIVIFADDVANFSSEFFEQAIHLVPGSTLLIAGDWGKGTGNKKEETNLEEEQNTKRHNRATFVYISPSANDEEWIAAIQVAVERWDSLVSADDEAATVERLTDFYHSVLEGLPQGLALFNESCRLILCNHALAELLEVPQSSLLNTSYHTLCSSICEGPQECIVEQTLQDGIARRLLQTTTSRDGTPKTLEMLTERIAGVFDGPHVMLICRNVSKRIELEQQSVRQLSELQMLGEVSRALHSAKDLNEVLYLILIAVTSDMGIGFNRGFFLLLDPETAELTGALAIGPGSGDEAGKIWSELSQKNLTLQELFGDWREHIGSDRAVNEMANRLRISLKENNSMIPKAVVEQKPMILRRSEMEHDLIWHELDIAECAIVPLISKERVEGVLLVDNAITRRPIEMQQLEQLERFADMAGTAILDARWYKQLEQRLKELRALNAEMRENRDRMIRNERLIAIGEIVATVAHEIRNPLAAIGGLARAAKEDLEPSHVSQQHLSVIIEEIHHLERIVTESLDFTRPWKSLFVLTSLSEKVHLTLKMMAGELDPEQYYVQTYFDPDAEWVRMDTDQIGQVLYNILKNAVYAMPGGGVIVITTKRDADSIHLDIRDYGKGVPQEIGEKIFDPFFTTKASGSGIGLSVSRQIMQQHGGRLSRISIDGPGAMFRLTFPLPGGEEGSHEDSFSR